MLLVMCHESCQQSMPYNKSLLNKPRDLVKAEDNQNNKTQNMFVL